MTEETLIRWIAYEYYNIPVEQLDEPYRVLHEILPLTDNDFSADDIDPNAIDCQPVVLSGWHGNSYTKIIRSDEDDHYYLCQYFEGSNYYTRINKMLTPIIDKLINQLTANS